MHGAYRGLSNESRIQPLSCLHMRWSRPAGNLTLARTGGGVGATPLRFFVDSEKTAARSAAWFWATLWSKPCAIFGKKKN